MADSTVAKSGWVLRQSNFLRKWKRSWLVLYLNGNLKYFESETSSSPEDTIIMRRDCLSIKTGNECVNVTPPDNMASDSLFLILCRNEKYLLLCGDSLDDMKAWHLALEQARATGANLMQSYPEQTYPVQSYPSYSYPEQFYQGQSYSAPLGNTSVRYVYPNSHPGQHQYVYYNGSHPAPYTVTTPGQTTVIYQNRPAYRYGSSDLAFGMLAGAAVGTMLWGPCLWW